MLAKLNNCRAYADINKCISLLNILKNHYRSFHELQSYFANDIIITMNLEDTLSLFEVLGYLEILIEDNSKKYKSIDLEYTQDKFIEAIFHLLIKNKLCELNRVDLNFYIQINQQLYAIRNLLSLSEVITKSPNSRYYQVSRPYINFLQKFSKKMSKKQLLKKLEQQDKLGEQAEKYVIDLEHKKFNSQRIIKHIALEDVNAGYDILSYIDKESIEYDKFIEVKCYSDEINKFFISKNEIEQSKKLGKSYYLYLVNSKFDSHPIVIQNPYTSIFNNLEIQYEIDKISYNVDIIIQQQNM